MVRALASSDPSEKAHNKRIPASDKTRTLRPAESTVARVFEEIASRYHDSTAVVFGEERVSYAELNARANRLAHQLRALNVGPETLVGCCLERSVALVVSLVAILKAGGAYVPLDPTYPKERFDLLLSDARPAVVLTQRSLAATVLATHSTSQLVLVDDERTFFPDTNPTPAGTASSLAYVMHTSGSTGTPKGVMVENRAILRLVRNSNFCRLAADEVFLQFAPISFDASTFEIWGALLNGASLVVMQPQACSLQDLGRAIRAHGVTTLWLTAGLFNVMVEEWPEDLRPVRQLLTGGDVLSPRHVRQILEALPDCCLINGYGPTENTTFTCCHRVHHGDDLSMGVPIGRPISNSQAYVLDERLRPVPVGMTGEIYAAGDGVARGYLNGPKTTAERFLPDPFAADAGSRMYRTGDLGRWRSDGVLEFLGRADNQVKILGHRVELSEVEGALATHPDLKQVCVVAHAGDYGSRRLAAYYTVRPGTEPRARELREVLSQRLPRYMIPSLFIPVSALPLSPSGKVDRAALPIPKSETQAVMADPNSTRLDRAIIELWRRLLGTSQVGLDESFFDLGGNSLLLTAMHSKLQTMLQKEIPIADLFEFATVRALARHLAGHQTDRSNQSDTRTRAIKQRAAFARQREFRI